MRELDYLRIPLKTLRIGRETQAGGRETCGREVSHYNCSPRAARGRHCPRTRNAGEREREEGVRKDRDRKPSELAQNTNIGRETKAGGRERDPEAHWI